jgi:hypothetical protein
VIRSWLGHVSVATANRYIEIDLSMKAKALEACEVAETENAELRVRIAMQTLTVRK